MWLQEQTLTQINYSPKCGFKKSLKIPKQLLEAVNGRRTDNI